MKKRILVSLIFIPLLTFVVYAPYLFHLFFFLLLALLSFLASREIEALLRRVVPFKGERYARLWFILPPLVLLASGYTIPFVPGSTRAILYVSASIVPVLWLVSCALHGAGRGTIMAALFVGNYVYCGVFPLLLLFLRREGGGFVFICFLFAIAWINDAAAYFIGTYFGKTRGIVKYSPNKSLEGYVGAFCVSMVMVNVFKLIVGDAFVPNFLQTNLLGLGISVMSPLGDLGESVFKRKTGVKDSSRLIPGMGGVLDVFDSILVSSPVYFFLVKLLV
jgi:phosphatidate cytidylyltransferase